ncbi:MAG: NPCBM/NEW2 domain-containing protein [Planctomycetes bacterium]|nr:NPCBM/NEW2 domain-containing protein [Planctomycetota bacterium]
MRCALLGCVLALFAPLTLADEVKTLTGKSIAGTVTAITESDITVKTDAGEVKTPLAQVLAVDLRQAKPPSGNEKYSAIRLLDDTVLQCKGVAFKGKEVELTLTSGAAFQLPLSYVISILHDAGNARIKKQWDQFGGLGAGLKRDRIFILKGPDLNTLDGTLGEVDVGESTIAFTYADKQIPLKLDKLQGMYFYRTEFPPETPKLRVIDVDGNVLAAKKINFDGETVTVTSCFGATVALTTAAVAKLDYNLGKLTFLSDIEPAKVVEKSGIGLVTRYRRDANLDGEPILLERQYAKGLSIHSHTELEYNLAGKYKEFTALLGVDARTGAESKALVTIFCDGEKRFSEVVSAKAPQPVNLNVKDVQVLRIVVSSQNFLDLYDHATLAEARVSQ